MLEKRTGKVEIKDVDPGIFQELLKFMYSGKEPSMDNGKWGDLMVIADKYAVVDLITICEENIGKNISVDNAASVLIIADLMNSEDLKKKAIHYIIANKNEVIDTDGYREMVRSHIHLIEEIYFAKSKNWQLIMCMHLLCVTDKADYTH